MKTPVTVLGLGAMGTALARAFLAAGHPTTVWNRTPGRSPELDTLGATRAATAAEAVAASPLVVVCLLVDATVRSTLDGLDLTGRTVANLTNGTPAQARDTATWAAAAGASYLDGGIMAVPAMIGGPAAFIFYSGSPVAFERHQADLAAMARPEYVGSDPGWPRCTTSRCSARCTACSAAPRTRWRWPPARRSPRSRSPRTSCCPG